MTSARLVSTAVALFLLGGCAPVVDMRHTVGPDVCIPPGTSLASVNVGGGESTDVGSYLRSLLSQRFDTTGGDHELRLYVRLNTQYQTGSRMVRTGWGEGEDFKTTELPTARLTAAMECDFVLHDLRSDESVILATSSTYDSQEDPRVRKALGLGRSDDPTAIQAPAVIARELADQCVAQFDAMTSVVEHASSVRLRGPMHPHTISLVRRGDFEAAARWLEPHAIGRDDPSLWFSLGVLEERLGNFAKAQECYERALWDSQDPQIQERLRVVSAMKVYNDILRDGYPVPQCRFIVP